MAEPSGKIDPIRPVLFRPNGGKLERQVAKVSGWQKFPQVPDLRADSKPGQTRMNCTCRLVGVYESN
jgi:hypothetical protein